MAKNLNLHSWGVFMKEGEKICVRMFEGGNEEGKRTNESSSLSVRARVWKEQSGDNTKKRLESKEEYQTS